MQKIVRLGSAARCPIYCRIEFTDGELSIMGVIGPTRNGDAQCCGQIQDTIREYIADGAYVPAEGWTQALAMDFVEIWNRWHLNRMNAGTPAQMGILRAAGLPRNYETACNTLRRVGMLEVMRDGKPYRYGQAWIFEEVPAYVIAFLDSLPDSNKEPPRF